MVCCGWPYVNDRPHLGTLIQLLSADVYARYLRLKSENAVLVSGSDEHGAPIEVEALKQGIPPRTLTNKNHQLIKKLLKQFNIQFDNYTRTESPIHIRFVQEFYKKVEKRGYVHTETLTLPFCEHDKRFLPDRFVEGECPHCHSSGARGDQCDTCGRILEPTDLINSHCVLCGHTPVLKKSQHWFFDLPKLANRLAKYVRTNPNFPENARNFSLSWIQEGLKARSLTRDISWGIPAPFEGAKGKTLYVWMEAVLGYVSATKEWAARTRNPALWKKYWFGPDARNIHFIGKDNIPFHTIIFPGLLLGSGDPYSLPWQVSSTEYIQFEGSKFSKSRKIGVWMDEALELEDSEYWRYSLISLRPEQKDVNFTWEEFERKVNTELNDVIGNFVHRTVSFLQTHFGGVVPRYNPQSEIDEEILLSIERESRAADEKFKEFRLKEALERVVDLAREGNRYLNEREPWRAYKTSPENAGQTIAISIQIVASIAVMLQPFLPETSSKILKAIVRKRAVAWDQAGKCLVKPGARILPFDPLFHKVSASSLRERLIKLRSIDVVETKV